jgi:hypothetical protein
MEERQLSIRTEKLTYATPIMTSKLHPHFPIITHRVEFSSLFQSQSPTAITPHIDFAEVWTTKGDSDSRAVSRDQSPSHYGDDELMEIDELESDVPDDSVLPNNLDNEKIAKPTGEPGRPNSGGYNIEHELRVWGADKISEVTVSRIIK